jgi:pantothenate kinase
MSGKDSPAPAARQLDLDGLVSRLAEATDGRRILAIAGAPGSGKSTVAALIEQRLNGIAEGTAAVLAMDGFHYDDGLLEAMGRRARKGAPDTFDVGGLQHMLMRLRANLEEHVAVPVFDRDLEIARAGARLIPRHVRVILVEGNYLLLRDEPWALLRPLFDITVMLEASPETLRERLAARWQRYDLPADVIRQKVEENDLPNGRLVMAQSCEADLILLSHSPGDTRG